MRSAPGRPRILRSLYLKVGARVETGLFGMNLGGIPLADHPHGFALVVTLLLVFTALTGFLAFRKRG